METMRETEGARTDASDRLSVADWLPELAGQSTKDDSNYTVLRAGFAMESGD